MDEQQPATIVVGVVDGQADNVLKSAIDLARAMRARLVCAHVDPSRYFIAEMPDGTVESLPIDSDVYEDAAAFPAELLQRITTALDPSGVSWTARQLAGEPATALAYLAGEVGASIIVVGTRHPGFRGAVTEFFDGSVAVHLAHRQQRPVLVVPQSPHANGALPWENEE